MKISLRGITGAAFSSEIVVGDEKAGVVLGAD
jgi:hypothetical protein